MSNLRGSANGMAEEGESPAGAKRLVLDAWNRWCHSAAALPRPVHGAGRVDGVSQSSTMAGLQAMDLGTTLFTWLRGERVGTDAFGNRYYRNRRLKRYGRERRWVLYKGDAEASKVPPEWHAWLHHMVEEPLTDESRRWPWQKEHVPNLSGTPYAYRPKGHDLRGGKRAHATGDYEPWTPE